ncbi:MAG: efflux RND transporter permease subunit, partial [Parabacteroides sp.]|nr:efflux RND transporter permease subunit [Parabacteroides sp.]
MIKFLLQRPIAVLMAFTACFIVGLVTYFSIPVSLLPDIAIPEITVQVSGQNTSARELENTVVKSIRQQLMQVANLRDIHSETRDGAAIIRLNFNFGTNTDLAFIEVNEKIDAAMNYLPREIERPRVIKASATDIPVFCLNLTLKKDKGGLYKDNEAEFLDLCQFAETVIKRRIEQLPEVAMVDVTGLLKRQVQIVPDMKMLKIAELTLDDIETALTSNNIEPGSMTVRDGYYEYNIKFSTLLRTPEDVENIYIRKNDHIFQLKELAQVSIVPEKESGASLSNGKRAVTLAIIKQADENMENMKEALQAITSQFTTMYPDIEFSVSRNQTELLDYTISNLKQNLSLGFFFICIVAILFLGDIKSPIVIGLSMVVSLIISFLFFYLFNMSLNIISISGLILALGMMIDSSIIVTENIAQYKSLGYSLEESCSKGTTEVITPMLSSTFTTIVVFAPLVFMSGIAGAIFYDQAFAVTVGLLVSYFTGIMLLPVLYKLVYSLPDGPFKRFNLNFKNLIPDHVLDRFYDTGVDFVFRHKTASLLFLLCSIPLCAILFYEIPKSRMPEIEQNELITHIEWNENIHIDENRNRIHQLSASIQEQ